MSPKARPAALIAWGLYILSLPSANLLVIVGLIVAYAGAAGRDGVARAHIDAQIAPVLVGVLVDHRAVDRDRHLRRRSSPSSSWASS